MRRSVDENHACDLKRAPPGQAPDKYVEDHWRLLEGDRDARDRLAAALLPELSRIVRRSIRFLDSDAVGQAVDEAVMDYLKAPRSFDPDRGSLVTFLTSAAVRNGFDLRRADVRRLRIQGLGAAWLAEERCRAKAPASDMIAALMSKCCSDATERRLARAWLEGATIDELAALVGLRDAHGAARKQAVRRWTERLRLRFKRHLLKQAAGRRAVDPMSAAPEARGLKPTTTHSQERRRKTRR